MELLQGQQQQLVEQARASAPPAACGGEVDLTASDLAVAHALLMRSLMAERGGGTGGAGEEEAALPVAHAPGALGAPLHGPRKSESAVDPRQSIAEVAARLQAQGESPDAVRTC